MSPRVGELRERVTLQDISSRNAYGEANPTDIDTVWAKVEPQLGGAGAESTDDESEARRKVVEFTVRHRTDVSQLDRLKWGGEVYDIESAVDPTGMKRWLRLRGVWRS